MDFQDPQLFINRELSWLAFNERVLAQAADASLPLFERLKFFAITAGNLDEFFMVRVAGLKQQAGSGLVEVTADGMVPGEQLAAIASRVHRMTQAMSRTWEEELVPRLAAIGLHVLSRGGLTAEQRGAARGFFQQSVFPALTPLAVDPGHPFPHLRNKSLNVAVLLRREQKRTRGRSMRQPVLSLAVVQVPSLLSRLVTLPASSGQAVLPLGELIALHAGELFPGYAVEHTASFRVTRNWDLNVDEEESEDLLASIQQELRRRDRGAAVRLELDAGASPVLEAQLQGALGLTPQDVYRMSHPLQPSDLLALADLDGRPEHRVEPFVPAEPPAVRDAGSLLQLVGTRDVLLHHPYESFDPVVRFLEEAAEDPQVLAIKQTLYRTTADSAVARALTRAVENGKQVAVLVELKARLDEANNIAWARRMEESGVHVVYGLIGLKTHCKMAMVVRREGAGIRRYVHLGTGNYNATTARQYTDISYFTARQEIADDVTALFNLLTGYSTAPTWKRLAVAPMVLHERVVALIRQEADKARAGRPARIRAKMNSLVDAAVIRELYAASAAGVDIELVVRGICCLRPGVPGVSERIRVVSVVDRFLEHARVFAFGVGDEAQVYFSSADWMPRNFQRRIEVMAPVEDAILKQRLLDEVLQVSLEDTVRARALQRDGTYVPVPVPDGAAPVRSQVVQLELARRRGEDKPIETLLRHAAAPAVPTAVVAPMGSAPLAAAAT